MQHIVNTIQKEGTALPHDDAFELVSSRGIFLDYGCLVDGEQYTLQQRHKLEVKPASNWGDYELDVLRIHVKEVDLDSFIRQIWNEDVIVEPSSSSVILEDDLMTLSDESLQLYASEEFGILSASALHRDPLVKALHLTDRVSKFEAKSNYEAAANAFLRFLLPRVGFTRGQQNFSECFMAICR